MSVKQCSLQYPKNTKPLKKNTTSKIPHFGQLIHRDGSTEAVSDDVGVVTEREKSSILMAMKSQQLNKKIKILDKKMGEKQFPTIL